MNIILFISTILLTLILNYIFVNKKLLFNFKGDNHQKFISSSRIPLSGGLILIFTSYYYLNLSTFTYIFFIFCLGFLSDIKKIILVSGTVIEEKYTTPNTIKVWIINLNFGESIFFMSDKKPIQNIKKTKPKFNRLR